jgi:hypothetical protein
MHKFVKIGPDGAGNGVSSSDACMPSIPLADVVGEVDDTAVKAVVIDISTPESASPGSRLQFNVNEVLGGLCTVECGLDVNRSDNGASVENLNSLIDVGLELSFMVVAPSVLVEQFLFLDERPSLSLEEEIIGFRSAWTAKKRFFFVQK